MAPYRMAVGYTHRFRSQFLLANATDIEVHVGICEKYTYFQCLKDNSPSRRSHEVRRIPALRDRFRASSDCSQCSAKPA